MAGKHHVILGAGTAGINAIRTLRQCGDHGEITLVSAEPPYSRMVLPYYLERSISESHVTTVSPIQLERWGVETRYGVRAEKLDSGARTLHLDDGESLKFDNLLIATGSSAVRPDVPGADLPGVHSFWTLDDARAVHTQIQPGHHVAMVGAGFISFTILDGILARAGSLTIIESEPRILPRMVDDAGAAVVAKWLTETGITLRVDCRLKSIEAKGGGLALGFASGKPVQADMVIMATGIRPNLEWLEGSGLDIASGGIRVDDGMHTEMPGIYAAGDVAQGPNRVTGNFEVHAIEPTAMEHGRVAGANMAGGKDLTGGKEVAYAGSVLMNIVSVAGLDLASFGSWEDQDAEIIVGEAPQRSAYRKYLFQGDRMTGAIVIGSGDSTWSENDLGMIKGLVQTGHPLGEWKEFLRARPFEIKKPYIASGATQVLMPDTVLGHPSPAPTA